MKNYDREYQNKILIMVTLILFLASILLGKTIIKQKEIENTINNNVEVHECYIDVTENGEKTRYFIDCEKDKEDEKPSKKHHWFDFKFITEDPRLILLEKEEDKIEESVEEDDKVASKEVNHLSRAFQDMMDDLKIVLKPIKK